MKHTLLALCAFTLLGFLVSFADTPVTTTLNADQLSGAQYAANKYNADQKILFDNNTKAAYLATQATLPKDQQVAYDPAKVAQYVPLTAVAYAAWRFNQVTDSWLDQKQKDAIADPANQAIINAVAAQTPEKQAAIKAQIQALLSQP